MTAGLPSLVLHEHQLVLDQDDVERVRSYVVARFSRRARLTGLELDDLVSEVIVHVLRAQQRPGSRWSPERGSGWDGYLYQLACTGAENAFRRPRRWSVEVHPEEMPEVIETRSPSASVELADVLALLDTEEEREAACLMAEGLTAREMRDRMGWTSSEVAELRTRVRLVLGVLR